MTNDNRLLNIREEVDRADQALKAAEALAEQGLHADSVSRAYYAAFHMLRALLLARGMEPKSHRGAIHLFNREFVRTGAMTSSHNRLLAGKKARRFKLVRNPPRNDALASLTRPPQFAWLTCR